MLFHCTNYFDAANCIREKKIQNLLGNTNVSFTLYLDFLENVKRKFELPWVS